MAVAMLQDLAMKRSFVLTDTFLVESHSESRAKGEGVIQVLGLGLTRDGTHTFAESVLQDVDKFNNVKIFADHLEFGDPLNRSVKDELGFIKDAFVNEDRTAIMGNVVITDPTFREKFANAKEADAMEMVKFSLVAAGRIREAEASNIVTVERIEEVFSVDHVNEDNAHAHLVLFESLNRGLTNKQREEETVDKVEKLEKQVEELKESLTGLKADNADLAKENEELKTSNKTLVEANTRATIEVKLGNSKLPERSIKKLSESLTDSATVEEIDAAIESEKSYLKDLGIDLSERKESDEDTQVLNMGGTAPPVEDKEDKEVDAKKEYFTRLKENFMAQGHAEDAAIKKAKFAAYGTDRVSVA